MSSQQESSKIERREYFIMEIGRNMSKDQLHYYNPIIAHRNLSLTSNFPSPHKPLQNQNK